MTDKRHLPLVDSPGPAADIGRDRGSPVSHDVAPFAFARKLNLCHGQRR